MKNSYIKSIMILVFCSFTANAQQTPAGAQKELISIVGATAHIGNGNLIKEATLIFENGLIKEIGAASEITPQGIVIDAKGKHLYPGFIIPNSTLGLGEIDAVRATIDADEIGSMLPHIRSLIAYNAESKVVESMRPNGVLLAQITPRGGRISGTSSLVQLDAWNWEDAAIKVDDGIHINWPQTYKSKYESFGQVVISEANEDYLKQVNELKHFLLNAKAYTKNESSKEHLPFQASKGIFDGIQKVYVHVKRQKGIIDAITLMKSLGLDQIVLVGADEAYKTIDLIKKENVAVLLRRTQSLPLNEDDDYDLPYKNAVTLVENDILVGLENSGQMERMNSRNLPFYAGITTGYGLTFEEALQLITLNTASILGIGQQYGSLEKGKSATLFISEGNALEMNGNIIVKAYIDGRDISLETHQTKLWKRYMDKYSQASE
ncbi:amidohydrolase family protein [Lutimonas halocynthiae]|uniref:amidohydrolase family protein n=1 Tax=Lutimonas halocynthiae TaxID=1446477 RepID=UPI0025B5ADF0|nr:amidohydrolase family protein [Lutimonas halocynthiae]MDN3644332.1 amidohydrolase family protein [Lutimonas halocynthiae]